MQNMSAAAAAIAAEDMKGMQVSTESNEAEEELGGPGEGMDADSDDNLDSNANGEASAKKKKKRKKKKKSGAGPGAQTTPPSVGLSQLFPDGAYPEGEFQQYKDDQRWRETDEEKRAQERADADMVNSVRKAAEVHRQVRSYIQTIAKPGILLIDMCEKLEDCSRKLIEENGLEAGIAFPTGCSLNHVAAHWTPNKGDKTVLQYDDVMVCIEGFPLIRTPWHAHRARSFARKWTLERRSTGESSTVRGRWRTTPGTTGCWRRSRRRPIRVSGRPVSTSVCVTSVRRFRR